MRLWIWALFIAILVAQFMLLDSKKGRGGTRGSSSSRGSGSKSKGGLFGGSKTKNKGSSAFGGSKKTKKKGFKKKVQGALGSKKVRAGIAAAAAAYITYKAGKKILKGAGAIGKAMMFGGNRYYWGPSYYNSYYGSRGGYQMCTHTIQQQDTGLWGIFNPSGVQMRQIVYGCRVNQYCCGMECCNPPYTGSGGGSGVIIAIVVGLLVMLCCCCGIFFIVYKFFRSVLDCILGPANDDNDDDDNGGNDKEFEPVPMQPTSYPTYAPQMNPNMQQQPPPPQTGAPPPSYGWNPNQQYPPQA